MLCGGKALLFLLVCWDAVGSFGEARDLRANRKGVIIAPLHNDLHLPAQRLINRRYFEPEDYLAEPTFRGTSLRDRKLLLYTFVKDPGVRLANSRLDRVPTVSLLTERERKAEVQVVLMEEDDGTVTAGCVLNPAAGAGSLQGPLQGWCSQLFSWLAPKLASGVVPPGGMLALDLVWMKELACSTISSRRFQGLAVWNHETLWARFENIEHLALSSEIAELLIQWNRVAILQSRKINTAFRKYITKQYVETDKLAAAFMQGHPPVCLIDQHVLRNHQQLKTSNAKVQFPHDFDVAKPYAQLMPACLAAYPVDTVIEYTAVNEASGRRETMRDICTENRKWAVLD